MYSLEAIKAEPPYYRDVIRYYKTNPCPKIHSQKDLNSNDSCNPATCFNYHSLQERRRLVFDEKTSAQTYEPKWCPEMKETDECQDQDSCKYCHTQNEISYHPLNYKTKLCTNCQFPSMPNQCPNYHTDEGSRAVALERFKMKKSRENSSQRQGGDFPGQKGFNLDTFKTKQCTSKGNHNPKGCLFFHSDKDKRRSTKIFKYGFDLCPSKGVNCPKGDGCEFAHNIVEQLYHPEKYKKKFCSYHPHRVQQCDYGAYCSFAHSESEIKIELLHNLKKDRQFYVYKYKTIFCPYTSDHDRTGCLYAHNPQDFRRDPQTYKYNPVKCPYWNQKSISTYEKGNCKKLMGCENCHGWKEFEYHPAVYKTKNCINENDCEKPDCPHFHPNRDGKEVVTTQIDFGAIAPPKQNFYNSIEKGAGSHYDHFKRIPVNKQSNFSGPIKLSDGFSPNKQGRQMNQNSQLADESTRPNSTASSTHHLDEKLTKRFSKKKQMSLQNKKEDFPNSLPSKLGPTQGKIAKRGSSAEFNFSESQFPKQEKVSGIYEEFKVDPRLKKSEIYGSLESLDGLIIGNPSEHFEVIDPFSELHDEQFKWNLVNALQNEGLAHTTQFLLSPMIECQALRSFNFRDFNKFPHISFQDKERIVQIISALIEEEQRTSLLRYDFQRGFASPTYGFERNFDKYHH